MPTKRVSLDQLITEIRNNSVAAAAKYSGCEVSTGGKIDSISGFRFGGSQVVMRSGRSQSLWCELGASEQSSVAALKKGHILQVVGTVEPQPGVAPTLRRCRVVSSRPSMTSSFALLMTVLVVGSLVFGLFWSRGRTEPLGAKPNVVVPARRVSKVAGTPARAPPQRRRTGGATNSP